MNKTICRLCLRTVIRHYKPIEETLNNILKLNLTMLKEYVICLECMNDLQVFFNLRSTCIDMWEKRLPLSDFKNDGDLGPVKIENASSSEPAAEPKDEIGCSFCLNTIRKESLITLSESVENISLVAMLKKHIRELNLNKTEDLLICKTCLNELQSVSRFLMKRVEVEEKIKKYIETLGTDDNGQVELRDVQHFVFKPTLKLTSCHENDLEQIYDQSREEYTMKAETEIKYETEVDDLQLRIKTEDIDIKSEQSDCDWFNEAPDEIKLNDPVVIPVYQCETCTYQAANKNHLNDHIMVHKSRSEIEIFKVEMCAFEEKIRKAGLKKNVLRVYKDPFESLYKQKLSETTLYKCEFCAYETRHKKCISRHKLTHKKSTEVKMVVCEICKFETKRKDYLLRHMLIHNNSPDVTLYNCETCTYKTKDKQSLNRHILVHKSPSEISMFKCNLCTFEAKRKVSINKHMLRAHTVSSETTLHKCKSCTYETKHKSDLNRHKLIHKKP